jgi:hypothetical protein
MQLQPFLVLLLLSAISSAAAAPWELGDIFATTHGRLNVIDSRTLVSSFHMPSNKLMLVYIV